MSYITIQDVSRFYPKKGGTFQALSHVDLTIDRGEFICLLGLFRFTQSPATEEESRVIIRFQQLPVILFHNRSQLLKIADHQKLYTTKRFIPVAILT